MRCVSCALEQMEMLGRVQPQAHRSRTSRRSPSASASTPGPLVAGYIGSSKALSYTVIGDTANTSARLCGVALPGQILVSETTLARLENKFEYMSSRRPISRAKKSPSRCTR